MAGLPSASVVPVGFAADDHDMPPGRADDDHPRRAAVAAGLVGVVIVIDDGAVPAAAADEHGGGQRHDEGGRPGRPPGCLQDPVSHGFLLHAVGRAGLPGPSFSGRSVCATAAAVTAEMG